MWRAVGEGDTILDVGCGTGALAIAGVLRGARRALAIDTAEPVPPGDVAQPSTRRERVGWYFYDWANSAFSTTVVTVFLGPYLTGIAENAAGCGDDIPCDDKSIPVLWFSIAPGSLFPYAVSLSVFLTVFVLPVVGAIADRSPH